MTTIAVDYDDTLVNVRTKEWLPGAKISLTEWLANGHTVIVHTCRANWPEGLAEVTQALQVAHFAHPKLTVVAKPSADIYIDDKALRFTGDWPATRRELRTIQAAA